MIVKFLLRILARNKKTRLQLLNEVMSAIGTFPTHAIITSNGERISIRGVPLDVEKQIALQHSAEVALDNPALKAIHEEVLYKAISHGIHNAQDFDQVIFAKAAIWFGQQERELLTQLAQGTLANSSLNGE